MTKLRLCCIINLQCFTKEEYAFSAYILNMKKLLSTVTALAMICTTAYAAPSMADVIIDASERTNEQTDERLAEAEISSPVLVEAFENANEASSDEKPDNFEIYDDARLMFDIYSGGDGSKESPYEISDADQLKFFSESINGGTDIDKYYVLTNDIDMKNASWTPVGFFSNDTEYTTVFSGSFDGGGFTVSNLKIENADTMYIGFFGLVYNGEIKNLTLDNITIDSERIEAGSSVSFVGPLAGRVISQGNGKESKITNCTVKNSSVEFVSDKSVYAGGLVGCAMADTGTEVNIFGVESDCDVSLSVTAKSQASDSKNHPAAAGGLFGYLSSTTGSSFSLRGSSAVGDVSSDGTSGTYVNVFAGGGVGHMVTRVNGESGGSAYISSCSATGNVTGKGPGAVNAGGFAGNIGATASMFISDCYASGNSEALSTYSSTSIGGFVGQLDFAGYSDSMGKTVSACYAAGNSVDLRYAGGDKKGDSYLGGFVGYSFAPLFESCYFLEKCIVTGSEIFSDSGISAVSAENSVKKTGYDGFDFENAWTINSGGDYAYPVLKKISGVAVFYSDNAYFDEICFGSDGKVSLPAETPAKDSTKEWTYTFSHWSTEKDGEAFDFKTNTLKESTVFYAVFSSAKRKYSVSFYSDGVQFGESVSVEYGQGVVLPATTPSKSDEGKYRYVFSHWSQTTEGAKVDFNTFTVTGDVSFYAVFTSIDKTAWSGEVAKEFAEGQGTKALPYVISSAEELALLAKVTNEGDKDFSGAFYVLGNDINLGYKLWTPVGTPDNPFSASLDGNGYTVKNFKIVGGDYIGLFGYVRNAEIKNLSIESFDVSADGYSSDNFVYIGGLAGFTDCLRSDTNISGIQVSFSSLSVNASAPVIYAGGLTGYINSKGGDTTFSDCFAAGGISVKNTHNGGVTYLGGLAGYMYTYSNAISSMESSYFTGSVYGYGAGKSRVGGLVGEINSYGSKYTPSVPVLSAESDDIDVMLKDSFSAASSVKAACEEGRDSYARAGLITAEMNQFAGVSNVFYLRGSKAEASGEIYTCGTSASKENFTTEKFLGETLNFDFDKVWTFVSGKEYPVLKAVYSSERPTFKINSVELEEGTLEVNVTTYAKADRYTVTVSVYDERGRLLGIQRKNLTATDSLNVFSVSFENLPSPYLVKASAIDALTLSPLFSVSEEYV